MTLWAVSQRKSGAMQIIFITLSGKIKLLRWLVQENGSGKGGVNDEKVDCVRC